MKGITSLVVLSLTLIFSVSVSADTGAAKIFSVQGTASVERGKDTLNATEGLILFGGDEVVTGEPGRVAIELPDGSYVRVASGSRLKIVGDQDNLGLINGAMHFFSHSEKHPVIETQTVTAAIRGTEFTLVADAKQTTIAMISGEVEGTSADGSARLSAGQGAHFRKGRSPEIFALISSDKSVQWSMFVPLASDLPKSQNTERALRQFREGNPAAAIKGLERFEGGSCNAEQVVRGEMLLALGEVGKGEKLLATCAEAQGSACLRASAQAALANLKLMRGDTAAAEQLSLAALTSTPASESAKIARSYVLQERGDLDGALALFDDSASGDGAARRAELMFMAGRVPEARRALEAITSRSWYAEAVYGFVLMADRSFSLAEDAFKRSAALEPGAGLPLVGLGIINVNRGDLAAGRREFERATVLEPSRALYRSYLGKAYFEDDLYGGAEPEYQRAIELDPRDPTAYLYRSFMRVAENDLVGALRDLNQARELSETRNVYRSKFLLDQDSAMRSASVGRVYQQLGFKERGRIEAITAITDDYTNPTAHRLLSQTQEDIFSADTIASEQRISNLFSPLSINVVDSIGTGVSLNEYSQLFERDGWRTASNTYFDSQDTAARTGVLSAFKDENIVVGLSADGAIRDGIADDPRASAGTVGFSLQGQPSWADRFLVEGRGVFSGTSDPEESVDGMTGTFSAAYLHRFSPEVTGVIQSTYDRDRESRHRPFREDSYFSTVMIDWLEDTRLLDAILDQRIKRYETSVVSEGQLIARTGSVTSILTLRNATNDIDSYDKSEILEDESGELDGLGATLRSAGATDLNGNSVSYLGDLKVSDPLHLQFGGEFESIEWASQDEPPFSADTTSKSLLSPKAGIVYTPSRAAVFRAGYGEGLGKGSRTDLVSIEPVLIGGITQRYNDLVGTSAQNLGLGVDLNPRESTFIGAEWTRRWLDENRSSALYEYVLDFNEGIGYPQVDLGENYDVPIGQDLVSAYGYEVLSRRWVAGLDYRYVKQDIGGDDPSRSNDHRSVAFSRYFFSNGWFLQGSATYRYQDRTNIRLVSDGSPNGSDGAWFMGAGIGYRLPTRHGLVLLDVQNIFGQDIALDQLTYFNEPVFNDPTVRLALNFNF